MVRQRVRRADLNSRPARYNKSVPAKVKKVEKKVRVLQQQIEKKRWDVQSLPNNFGWNGNVYPLSEIPEGTSDYNREGAQCYASSIHVQGAIEKNIGSTATTCRILLVNLKYPRASNITWAELAQDNIPSGAPVIPTQLGTVLAPHFNKNFGTKIGFEVLWDRKYELNETTKNSCTFEIRRSIKKKIYYNEDSTNQTEKNKLFLMVISDQNGAAEPEMVFTSRLYFQG